MSRHIYRFVHCLVVCCLVSLLPTQSSAEEAATRPIHPFSKPFVDAAKKAQPSVVSITAKLKKPNARQWRQKGIENGSPDDFWEHFFGISPSEPQQKQPKARLVYGSGFIVSTDGYILTNNHVIDDAENITVQLLDGKEYPATKIGSDPSTDIALVKIEATNLPALILADSSQVEIGEWVLAIGNPFGLQASVTTGVISAKGRSDFDTIQVEKFFQTDAAINSGSSGGPLVDLYGQVVGMNTAIASQTGGYIGICFAIPSNLLKDVMKELIEHGESAHGYLGVALQRVDTEMAKALGLDKPQGGLVAEVVPGGPADEAGIKSGDVILEVQGVAVDTLGTLRNAIALMKPGETLSMKIRRNGQDIAVTAKIAQRPGTKEQGEELIDSFGIVLEPVTAELAKRYRLDSNTGLLVVEIDPDSQAYQAGLRAGHVILSVNGRAVSTIDEFSNASQAVKKGDNLLLQVKIGNSIRFIPLVTE
jgi:serine protease Do